MTTTLSPASRETYQPAPVKKSRIASLITAGVAGVAGLALAATFSYFTQDGSADYDGTGTGDGGDAPVWATDMDLGDLIFAEYEDGDYEEFEADADGNPVDADGKRIAPVDAVESDFVLTNANQNAPQVARLFNVESDNSDPFYGDIWVRITRQKPNYPGQGDAQFRYFGKLSEMKNVYMGSIYQGSSQIFDVEAWTDTHRVQMAEPYSAAFQVNYSVDDGSLEETYEPVLSPEDSDE